GSSDVVLNAVHALAENLAHAPHSGFLMRLLVDRASGLDYIRGRQFSYRGHIMRRFGTAGLAGVVGLVVIACAAAAGAADRPASGGDIPALTQATIEPGKVIKIDDPATGGSGNWVLYIPSDYVATRKWPVIFCYHGLGLQPTSWPFQDLTDGKGYIIVGMEYLNRDVGAIDNDKNVANLKRIHDALSKKLPLDPKLQFIGGFSQGGWRTTDIGEATLDAWAGLIILGAGRDGNAASGASNFKGKSIFIAAGENDGNLAAAKSAVTYYQSHGADATQETFAGMGHNVDTKDAPLKKWLLEHGPLTYVKSAFDQAKALEKSGKKGQAYVLYQQVISQDQPGDMTDQAKTATAADEADAAKTSDDGESAITAGKFSDGLRKLLLVSQTYAGSPLGEKAAARVKELRADPSIHAQLAQATIDASADQAEARAVAAEKSGDYKSAIADYQAYVAAFPKSHRIDAVTAHLKTLQADPAIQAKITTSEPEKNCKRWLSLADSYIQNGDAEQAKVYLQKVIDKYPDTTWADTAKQKLQDLGNGG
ncbi:MAG TPA: tetratricopeptide repeat protein, partial [Rhizomicrobium sp.]|nr:tetratricopeptide repeat protein [Rhizomicrobium sp.]